MRAFVSQIIPQNSMTDQPAASQAANNFCSDFLQAAEIDFAVFLIPIFVKKKVEFKYELDIPFQIVQSRILPQNRFGVFINTMIENINILIAINSLKVKTIWFYNLTIHNAISFILIKWILQKPCFIIIADLVPIKSKFDINRLILKLIMKSDGIISLSHKSDLIINHPNYSCLSGIVHQNIKIIQRKEINRKDILFSGYLRSHAGIHLALESFAKYTDLNLIITGRGDEEKLVQEYSQKYSNIKYLGFLEFNEYLKVLNDVDIVLNLRDPSNKENLYNFPSKMIEYLNHGKIVISTMEYPQFFKDVYFYSNFEPHCLVKTILKVLSFDDTTLNKIVANSQQFVNRNFSPEAWCNLVNKIEGFNQHLK